MEIRAEDQDIQNALAIKDDTNTITLCSRIIDEIAKRIGVKSYLIHCMGSDEHGCRYYLRSEVSEEK